MNWNSITVGQYQQVCAIVDAIIDADSEFVAATRVLTEVGGRNQSELDELSMYEFWRLYKVEFGFLDEPVPVVPPVNAVRSGRNLYNLNYDITATTKGQYDEVMMYSKTGINSNLHLLMASITKPVWFWWGSKDHAQRAEHMKGIPFIVAYSCAVFFWTYYKKLLNGFQESLQPLTTTMTAPVSQADS